MTNSDIYKDNIDKVSKDDKKISLAFTLIAITSTLAINHSDSTIPERQYVWVSHMIMALSLVYILIKALTKHVKLQAPGLLVIFLFWWLVNTFYVYKLSYISLNLSTIGTLFLFCYFNKQIWNKSYELYYKYIVMLSSFGIIAYLCTTLSINILPKTICPYYAERLDASYMYYDYYLSYVLVEFPYIRLCGLFNEPGYYGTFLGLILVAEKFDLKKKSNIILLIAGIFTFSAAFFITLILFFVIKLILTRNYKILFTAVLLFLCIPFLNIQNENFTHLMERFTFVDGKLNAINRTGSSFDLFFNNYIQSADVLFGYGRGYLSYYGEIGNLSYKTYIVEFGLLACAVFWLGIFYNSIKLSKKNRLAIVFALLFMVNIYQRPGIYVFGYMLLLYGGVINISIKNKLKSLYPPKKVL